SAAFDETRSAPVAAAPGLPPPSSAQPRAPPGREPPPRRHPRVPCPPRRPGIRFHSSRVAGEDKRKQARGETEEDMQPRSLKGIAFAAALVTNALALVSPLGAAEQNAYVVTNLVSSGPAVPAAAHDASLVNGWGLTASSSSPWARPHTARHVSTPCSRSPRP